jgi:hypothetical protein
MRSVRLRVFVGLALLFPIWLAAQDVPAQEETPPQVQPLFVRVTVYPTANLSRYDYNNDIDLYEIRVYVVLRDGSVDGDVITNAAIYVLNEKLEFTGDLYEKRFKVSKEELVKELAIRIALQEGRSLRETFFIPDWLVLTSPRPEIVPSTQDLNVTWKYSEFSAPVDLFAYNFKTGQEICSKRHLAETSSTLTHDLLPEGTIVRIWVMQSWLSKRFFFGEQFARGSEMLVIPWSQVFIRTK